jgi:hypothetical protein
LKYTDPSGEWWLIDDLIAAFIGGTVNLVINIVQGNVHSFSQGVSYFGVGAVGGVLTIYVGPWAGGAVMGAGNSVVSQGFGNDGNWNWDNVSGQQVLFDGIMGGLGGGLGAGLGGLIAPYVSNLTSSLGGQAFQQAATQAITGSATGFALGTGFSLMDGENFEDALKAGGKGALTGFAVGTATGLASGMRAAYKDGKNPWTGKELSTKAENISTKAYNHEYEYDERVRMRAMQDPSSHNFPYSYDDAVLSTTPNVLNSGYKIYQLDGFMNSKPGVYEIGVTKSGIINHRFFRPY